MSFKYKPALELQQIFEPCSLNHTPSTAHHNPRVESRRHLWRGIERQQVTSPYGKHRQWLRDGGGRAVGQRWGGDGTPDSSAERVAERNSAFRVEWSNEKELILAQGS